jgi:signal transduction histidine kinase
MADRLQQTVAALEVEKERAEAALRARRELVANVSHELRTPLALIRTHAESLAMATTEDALPVRRSADGVRSSNRPGATVEDGSRGRRVEERESDSGREGVERSATVQGPSSVDYLGVIQREVDRLNRLIDELFALSTAEAGTLALKLEPLDIGAVAAEVTSAIAPLARQERRVTVVAGVGAGLPPALADRQRLEQVLANLLRNALRHTPEGGLISIEAASLDDEVEITVADTGLGIAAEDLPHVFERFYRGDAEPSDRTSAGAGLGLAIVREFVEAMGGRVAAQSAPGQGSRFSFTLPAVESRG